VKNTHLNPMFNTMEGDHSSYLGITTMEPFQRYLSRVLTIAGCICSRILTKYTLIHLLCSLLLCGSIWLLRVQSQVFMTLLQDLWCQPLLIQMRESLPDLVQQLTLSMVDKNVEEVGKTLKVKVEFRTTSSSWTSSAYLKRMRVQWLVAIKINNSRTVVLVMHLLTFLKIGLLISNAVP